MSIELSSLSRDISNSLVPSLAKEVKSVCEDRTYETPQLAHEALKGLCDRLRPAGVHDNSYPILTIAGKMSELQADMNRAAIVTSIGLLEHKIECLKVAIDGFSKVSSAAEGEEEIPEVVAEKNKSKKRLEKTIAGIEKVVGEARALKGLEAPSAPRAPKETPVEPPRKRGRIAVLPGQAEEERLEDHLLLFKINQTYTRICSLLAVAAEMDPCWFTLRTIGKLPQVGKLEFNEKDADQEWLDEIKKEKKDLADLAAKAHGRNFPQGEERIKEIGFIFDWSVD